MARKKKRGATYAPQAMRGHTVTATARDILRAVRLPTKTLELTYVEDRRVYPHELRDTLFRDVSGAPAQVSRRPADSSRRSVQGVLPALYHRFETPRAVPVCLRRSNRRRVLFALRKTGRGSSNRRARWTAKSFIRCK